MISKFATVYPGHIDLPDHGQNATPANERRFSNKELAGVFAKTEAVAKVMDEGGWDTLWMAEHHFQFEGYEVIPNLLMLAVHLAHLTKNLKTGCGFNIAPMWHPLRLAEDYAMADILSQGRVIFGVARGYHTREVETFGAPLIDQTANRELFEEQVDIIFKAFNNERFSHQGKHYTLPPEVPYRGYQLKELSLVPRPLRLPVECWQPIQSGSQRALDFMAKHGIGGVIGGGSAEGGAVHKSMVDFQAAYARLGQHLELGERMALGFQFFIAESREAALREAAKYYEENMKLFGELRLVRALSEAQIEAMRHPQTAGGIRLPSIEDAAQAGGFLAGTPDEIIAQLKALEARYPGLDRITASLSIGVPLAVALEQLERFATTVMPAFKTSQAAVPTMAV